LPVTRRACPGILRLHMCPDVLVSFGFGLACPMTLGVKAARAGLGDGSGRYDRAGLQGKSSPQCFLVCSNASVCETWAALPRFAARFSFRDLPDFLVIVCRGDLSDILALRYGGLCRSRFSECTPPGPRRPLGQRLPTRSLKKTARKDNPPCCRGLKLPQVGPGLGRCCQVEQVVRVLGECWGLCVRCRRPVVL